MREFYVVFIILPIGKKKIYRDSIYVYENNNNDDIRT
jgi:hypothetical protein